MALEMLAGVTNAVASQPLFLFKAFSADNARIVFSRVNICNHKLASDSSGLSGGFRGIGRGFGL
jgi:hypothetical protein